MSQITARLPDEVVGALDAAARRSNRSRAEIVREAIERYLEDCDDLSVALERLQDPSDPVLDWDEVRGALSRGARGASRSHEDGLLDHD
ncbi:MAG: ribbon-helix-helix protein, CopG family [Gammaproteobacteria bacterium]|nr:ribbon-helix-helix protein, CopG family [Gammaproteobacteria bacterium]MYE80323.1 ribbon-helix-helix protein, CopG family [Gammaproteobacteria bacterium]